MATATTTPDIETLDQPRRRGVSGRAVRRTAWIALDLLAIGGFSVYALQALT
ncbi:MAG TPA: hypothetical protein VK501_09460 [Baekduia sp.]|uniref:hypothetical protein n=1 Tax=Baekduia sp. TaxID=2600305 RepID=UPI002C9C2B56|nr:hypothetical protein [Baekduia sp.]HMJ34134.1 hypothetical protein [Baekduia sp.]